MIALLFLLLLILLVLSFFILTVLVEPTCKETHARKRRIIENLKNGARNVAVIAEDLESAAAWQAELKKQGLTLLQESAIIKETHVCHLITATTDGNGTEIPRILADDQAFHTLIETFSAPGENIGIGGEMQELSDTVTSMGRQARYIHGGGLTTGNTSNRPMDQYSFTDSDVTDIE